MCTGIQRVALLAVLLTAPARPVNAQGISGELFAGAGAFACCEGTASAWEIGAGVIVPVGRAASISATIGGIGPVGEGIVREHSGYVVFGKVPVGSLSGAYHFRPTPHRLRPFVAAGIGTGISGDVAVGGLNFGGGVDFWTSERRGLRIELHDQLLQEFGTTHVVVMRIGLLVR